MTWSAGDSETLARGVSHGGPEYDADERGLVDTLIRFDRPRRDELDSLVLADLLVGPPGQGVSVQERLDEIFEPSSRTSRTIRVHGAVTRSRTYLEECAGRAAKRLGYPM
ncbi:MAG TPA: hypothetical protein VF728_10130 [Nocardioides sp.]